MKWFAKMMCVSLLFCIAVAHSANAVGADNDEMIRKHRMGELIIEAQPGAVVRVEQVRHEFWFGAAISSSAFGGRLSEEDRRKYKKVCRSTELVCRDISTAILSIR